MNCRVARTRPRAASARAILPWLVRRLPARCCVGAWPSGKATGFGPVMRRFESCRPSFFLFRLIPSGCALAADLAHRDGGRAGRRPGQAHEVRPAQGAPPGVRQAHAAPRPRRGRGGRRRPHRRGAGARSRPGASRSCRPAAWWPCRSSNWAPDTPCSARRTQILPGAVLVLAGDTPLITGDAAARPGATITGRPARPPPCSPWTCDDPTGYGRVVRDDDGDRGSRSSSIATPPRRSGAIGEVNSGMYVLPAPLALEILAEVGSDNDQSEIYLTDVIAGLRARGRACGRLQGRGRLAGAGSELPGGTGRRSSDLMEQRSETAARSGG